MNETVVEKTEDMRDRPEFWANIVASLDEAHYKVLDLCRPVR
jgi:hypothetical protein